MKIVVFGATGRTGLPLVTQALNTGHEVTAFVRNPSKLQISHAKLRIVQGDLEDAAVIEAAIAGQHAVLSALGPIPNGRKDVMRVAFTNIIAAMNNTGVKRLISLTGAGVAQPGDQPKLINKFISLMLNLISKDTIIDSSEHARLVRDSSLDWTIVRVPMLTDAPVSNSANNPTKPNVRVGMVGINDGMRIARSDVAAFMLKVLEDSSHIQAAPVISS
jgi:putative NADH-flavin reductase